MARARNIKPGFFKNENLCELPPMDRLLFAGLWCLADREGRLENRPKKIKMELFPCDNYDVVEGLSRLEHSGFIKCYQIEHFSVIQVVNFLLHQIPHGTEKDSELPDINGVLTVNKRKANGYITGSTIKLTVNNLLDNGVLTVKQLSINALNPESLILNPESLILNPESAQRASSAFRITMDWRPSSDASELIKLGRGKLPTEQVMQKHIANFVGYWRTRFDTKRQDQWDHAFADWVIRKPAEVEQANTKGEEIFINVLGETIDTSDKAWLEVFKKDNDEHTPERFRIDREATRAARNKGAA